VKTFEIRNGTDEEATVIGRVVAMDEIEAVSTLNAFRNGFKVTDPGNVGPPNAYVEWAHPEIEKIHPVQVRHWRARMI
jgi:hypothetical protein